MFGKAIDKLIAGYKKFQKEYISDDYAIYRNWAIKQQEPKVMIIACSDSRVNPAILTKAGLGDIFTVHNVANLVPAYNASINSHHSTGAAIEFAVCSLKVEHIVIIGHSQCGGICALMDGYPDSDINYNFINKWVSIANDVRAKVIKKYSDLPVEERNYHCEKESLVNSLQNLNSFPWVKERIEAGNLATHAWHFNIKNGQIISYDPVREKWELLDDDVKPIAFNA